MVVSTGPPRPPPEGRESGRALPNLILAAALVALSLLIMATALSVYAIWTGTTSVTPNDFNTDTLNPPTVLTAAGGASVNLSWTATIDTYASGHRVLRGTAAGGPYSQIAEVTPRTTATYTDSPAAGTYYYVLRAFYQGWESVNSNEASATVSFAGIALRNVASANNGAGATTLTIAKPAGVVANDVLLAQITVRGGTGTTITAPAGWTLVRRDDSGTTLAQAVFVLVAGAAEPASYTWTFNATEKASGGIAAYSGVNTTTPVNVHGGQANASSTSVTAPSVTTTVASARLVGFFGTAIGALFTPPAGMTEQWDTASTGAAATSRTASEGADEALGAAGATGTRVAAADAAAVNIGQLVALNPASAAPPPVISFRSAASAGAPSGTLTLTINKPTGTVAGDVMIASIAVRPNTATVTAPAGWTLIRRTDQAVGAQNSLAVYYKVAGGGEPANYTWTFSTSTGSAGGILTFSGVDTTNPINVENGQATPNGLTHATPSENTTVTSTMLVTSHEFSSAATWTPPAGMTETVDVASATVPQSVAISLEVNYVIQSATGATGAKTATASNDSDAGCTHILALRPAP